MARRSKFALAAEEWFRSPSAPRTVSSGDLWDELCKIRPDLTSASPHRKTPRATCMRDIRKDPAFDVGGGKITYRGVPKS